MSILRVENLHYAYKDGDRERTILEDINYEFEAGRFYAILGESGSGKTTFISLIAALDDANSGTILYKEENIKTMGYSLYRRKDVGIIFQDYNLIPYMTGIQNILTAMAISGEKEDKKRALFLLNDVGINEEVASRRVTTMSGGEKQRVAIARALVGNKEIIIADEPTGNLDAKTSQTIIDIFVKLAHEYQKCVIVVTHSQDVAAKSDIQLYLDSSTHQFVER